MHSGIQLFHHRLYREFFLYFPSVKWCVASFGSKFIFIYFIFVINVCNDNVCRMSLLKCTSVTSQNLCWVPAHFLNKLWDCKNSSFYKCSIRQCKLVSIPTMPKAAFRIEPVFSGTAWGAWSVLITLKEPSFSPRISASTSFFVRRGGFIL